MIDIQIVSDVVCPWCWIGKRRLEAAIALIEGESGPFPYRMRWLPFFLNPDTPPAGEPYRPFLEKKFGGPARVEQIFEHIRAAGRTCGLDYAFEKISLRANTLAAHRLIHWAQQQGDAGALVERLFRAQFQDGENVGDPEVLADAAAECGYDAEAVRRHLAADADRELILGLEAQARQAGISSVPTFILDARLAIVGAEDPQVIAAALRRRLQA